MRLTINTNSSYGYELKADNPDTSIAQDTAEAIQKLGQLEDIEEELPAFNGLQHLFSTIDLMNIKGEELHFTYKGKAFAIRKE